jgi:hypothetical protein
MSAERVRMSRRNLIAISLGLLSLLGAGLVVWWFLAAVGDRPIIVKGGSLEIESKDPFDDGYNELPTGHLDHKKTNNQIKCVKMMQGGRKLSAKECAGQKCVLKIYYAEPNNQDNKTEITIESLFGPKSLRIGSHPVKLARYKRLSPKIIRHPEDGENGLKKLVRAELRVGNQDIPPWPCPPNGNSYNCEIHIEYTDTAGEADCER